MKSEKPPGTATTFTVTPSDTYWGTPNRIREFKKVEELTECEREKGACESCSPLVKTGKLSPERLNNLLESIQLGSDRSRIKTQDSQLPFTVLTSLPQLRDCWCVSIWQLLKQEELLKISWREVLGGSLSSRTGIRGKSLCLCLCYQCISVCLQEEEKRENSYWVLLCSQYQAAMSFHGLTFSRLRQPRSKNWGK